MKTISAQVNDVEVILENEKNNLENQINVAKIHFEFDESWNKYDKYVVFIDEHDKTYKTAIIDNEVIIPSALVDGFIKFQVYGQIINDSTILERQPSKISGFKLVSSLNPTGLDVEIPSPSEWDNYIKQIENITNKIVSDEATRVENETNRETAEASRVSSETNREQYIADLKEDVNEGRFNGECNFATFNINQESGNLEMNKTENLLLDFALNNDGKLEVVI